MDPQQLANAIERTENRIKAQEKIKKEATASGDEVKLKSAEKLIAKYNKELIRLQRKL